MYVPATIIWDASPILVEIGPLAIRWYGALFAAGFLIGLYLGRWMFQRERKPVEHLDALLLYVIGGTVIGARLGHVFFYRADHFLANPGDIIKIWEGGLASHGGAIGILIAIYLYSRSREEQPFLWVLDRLAIPTALVASMIRIGNLFNSEILGNPADVAWAFVFTRIDNVPRHPVQLYESISYFLIFLTLFLIYKYRGPLLRHGLLSGLFLVLIFSARFIMEFFKAPLSPIDATGLSMGQWLSIPMVLIGIGLLYYASTQDKPTWKGRKKRRSRSRRSSKK